METSDTRPNLYDYMAVGLFDSVTQQFITSIDRVTNQSARNTWVQTTLDLSAYAGRSVYIVSYTQTDAALPSSFFIDDFDVR
jgi:hypothetical protein